MVFLLHKLLHYGSLFIHLPSRLRLHVDSDRKKSFGVVSVSLSLLFPRIIMETCSLLKYAVEILLESVLRDFEYRVVFISIYCRHTSLVAS